MQPPSVVRASRFGSPRAQRDRSPFGPKGCGPTPAPPVSPLPGSVSPRATRRGALRDDPTGEAQVHPCTTGCASERRASPQGGAGAYGKARCPQGRRRETADRRSQRRAARCEPCSSPMRHGEPLSPRRGSQGRAAVRRCWSRGPRGSRGRNPADRSTGCFPRGRRRVVFRRREPTERRGPARRCGKRSWLRSPASARCDGWASAPRQGRGPPRKAWSGACERCLIPGPQGNQGVRRLTPAGC
jgi:hypothetical protein